MKLKIFFNLTLALLITVAMQAQDCRLYFPDEVGTSREMTSYDKKDRPASRVVQTILEKDVSGQDITLKVETVIYDEDDEEFSRSEVEIGCVNGVFSIDMSEYVTEMLEAYQSMDIEMEGDNLVFPTNLSVGDNLPDGNINVTANSSGVTIMNMDITIANRKVEAKEEVTTPAGTFDCYKISYETVSKNRLMTVTVRGMEWIAEGVGLVKSESYNKKGKLTGYSLLTGLSN